jgi:hypothetical protein
MRLVANAGQSHIGSYVLGIGFVLDPAEAATLLREDPRNSDVICPYLNGEDVNSRPDQSPSRWVINFRDWEEERAARYSACFGIVRERVRPYREKNNRATYRRLWWLFGERQPTMLEATRNCKSVIVAALVTQHLCPVIVPNASVFAHKLCVFPDSSGRMFAALQATIHEVWAREHGSSLDTRLNYSPTDCFGTFPIPKSLDGLDAIGERYHAFRADIMKSRKDGLTATYNRFHDPKENAEDIAELRRLHVAMDCAVADAYGWKELDLGHGFHTTKQGVRYTIAEAGRREVLARLLKLNHERYAAEVAAGLHEKGKKKKNTSNAEGTKGNAGKTGTGDGPLFG